MSSFVTPRASSKQKFFFQFVPKQTETQSVSLVFRFISRNQKKKNSVCYGVMVSKQPKQTELFLNKPKQTEKISKKMLSIRVSSKQIIFLGYHYKKKKNFGVRTETKRNSICFDCFRFVYFAKPKKMFRLFRCFGQVSKQPKQTELMVWGIKKVYILTNLRLVFFVLVVSKHRNSLFRYYSETTETNILFRIVPKLVSVPVSVVSIRN
jgi:hypothetical protein